MYFWASVGEGRDLPSTWVADYVGSVVSCKDRRQDAPLPAPRSASLTLISRGFSLGFSLSNPLMPTFSTLRSVLGQFAENWIGVSDGDRERRGPSGRCSAKRSKPHCMILDFVRAQRARRSSILQCLLERLQDHHGPRCADSGSEINHMLDHGILGEETLHLGFMAKGRPIQGFVIFL